MIRVAVVVRSRALRAALERAVSQRASVVVVPLPVGGAAAPMAQLDADVALIDLAEWSNADGPARPSPRTAVIVLVEAPDAALIAATLDAGARGVLPYSASIAELTAAVEAAAAGLVVLPASHGPATAPERRRRRADGRGPDAAGGGGGGGGLTEREREVLALLAGGLPNRAIGARLGISQQTVKTYVAAILDKLDAATRAEAVAIGLRRGLIML